MSDIKTIAFYLPQYHPIPENDEWWGKGFTEWTNTAKAKPLFRGHYQPHVPADLGFYDLRLPEARNDQAELARQYGLSGFCYYHYWFGGERILERPFNEVLETKEPDFPFCLCWANQTWTGIWHGAADNILIEQTYPGKEDYESHFQSLLPAFEDPRYIRVDNCPVFMVYRPTEIPELDGFVDLWQGMAVKAGLPGLFLVGVNHNDSWRPDVSGFNASMLQKLPHKCARIPWKYPVRKVKQMLHGGNLTIYDYEDAISGVLRKGDTDYLEFPCVIPNWDNTPRSNLNGLVLHDSTPEKFRKHLSAAIDSVAGRPEEQRIVFIKSWNEWAEGNHLEPDLKYGRAYLEVIRSLIV